MHIFLVVLLWFNFLPFAGSMRGATELLGSWNVEVIGQLSGNAYVVAIQGAYAYIGIGRGVAVVNVSNPSSPWVMSQTNPLPDDVQSIFVAGSYAYVANQNAGLRILNVSDPYNPREVGYYQTPGTAKGVVVVGNLAYVADDDMGLRIVNVSNPFSPYEVGAYDTPGNASDVAVSGNLAYIAERGAGLRIVNVSNPGNPYQVGYYDAPGNVWGVEVEGNLAYVACFNAGLHIANVADPANPTEVGYYEEGQVYTMAPASGLAYVARGGNGLAILRYVGTSAPTPPSNLTATAVSSSQVNLSWQDNSSNEAGFRVYRNGALIATLGANVTSYQNVGLSCGTYYSYYVTAYNSGGESNPSNTAGATTYTCSVPAPPSNLTASAVSSSYINLSWRDNSGDEIGFRIYRNGALIATLGANRTLYQVRAYLVGAPTATMSRPITTWGNPIPATQPVLRRTRAFRWPCACQSSCASPSRRPKSWVMTTGSGNAARWQPRRVLRWKCVSTSAGAGRCCA